MSFQDLFPEPLFETSLVYDPKKICFACGNDKVYSLLCSSFTTRPIVPLCKQCSADWNFYGYEILKRLKPKKLITNILKFKVCHPFSTDSLISIYKDLQVFKTWGERMKSFKDGM